jgi:hypothetical protein
LISRLPPFLHLSESIGEQRYFGDHGGISLDQRDQAPSFAFDKVLNNTFRLVDYYEQQLRAPGVAISTIKTPPQRLEESAAETARRAKEVVEPDLEGYARAMGGRPGLVQVTRAASQPAVAQMTELRALGYRRPRPQDPSGHTLALPRAARGSGSAFAVAIQERKIGKRLAS